MKKKRSSGIKKTKDAFAVLDLLETNAKIIASSDILGLIKRLKKVTSLLIDANSQLRLSAIDNDILRTELDIIRLENVRYSAQKQKNFAKIDKNFKVSELSLRYKRQSKNSVKIKNDNDSVNVFRAMWNMDLFDIQEQFCAIFMNRDADVIGFKEISTGTVSSCIVDIHLICSTALLTRATSVIIAHNHPSGNLNPSENDNITTEAVKLALQQIDIVLLDALIITRESHNSIIM